MHFVKIKFFYYLFYSVISSHYNLIKNINKPNKVIAIIKCFKFTLSLNKQKEFIPNIKQYIGIAFFISDSNNKFNIIFLSIKKV